MSAVFADTSYFIALLGEDDEAHVLAIGQTASFEGRVVTTQWVLMELSMGLGQRE
jgi:predicted nucleic acid-binding protein